LPARYPLSCEIISALYYFNDIQNCYRHLPPQTERAGLSHTHFKSFREAVKKTVRYSCYSKQCISVVARSIGEGRDLRGKDGQTQTWHLCCGFKWCEEQCCFRPSREKTKRPSSPISDNSAASHILLFKKQQQIRRSSMRVECPQNVHLEVLTPSIGSKRVTDQT